MGTVVNFIQAYREKTWTFEKKMLREISLNELKKHIRSYFIDDFEAIAANAMYAEQMCLEIAVEAFLLGAKYSKFGRYGEKKEFVKRRSQAETTFLVSALKESLYFTENEDDIRDVRWLKCETFIKRWWDEGFDRGAKRMKLRL